MRENNYDMRPLDEITSPAFVSSCVQAENKQTKSAETYKTKNTLTESTF